MSLYALQKLLYELNRDPAVQEAFASDREAVIDRYRLSDEETAMAQHSSGELIAKHRPDVLGGIGEAESAELLRAFFAERR